MNKLKQVAADPAGDHSWAKRLTGQTGFRIRHGDWRAVYFLDYETGDMTVDRVAKREDIYR